MLVNSSIRPNSPGRFSLFQPTVDGFCAGEKDRLNFSTYKLTSIEDWIIDLERGWPRSDKSGSYWANHRRDAQAPSAEKTIVR